MKKQKAFVSTIENKNPTSYSDYENRQVIGAVTMKPNRAERRALAAYNKGKQQ